MHANYEVNDPKLAFLLGLASRNFRLFPVWNMRGNICGCGNPQCNAPGKHPIAWLVPRGVKHATFHEDEIAAFHAKAPWANWAIASGERLCVLDIDIKKGRNGEIGLKQLEEELGALPHTLRANTPSGGYHLFFEVSTELHSSASKLAPDVDVRGEGGYVVCAPSSTVLGDYVFEDEDMPIERLPDAWVKRIVEIYGKKSRTARAPGTPDAVIGEGSRNDHLYRLGCAMRGKGASHRTILEMLIIENDERCHPPLDEPEVKAIAESAASHLPPPPPPEATAEPPPEAYQPQAGRNDDWQTMVQVTKAGAKGDVSNITTILANDPDWEGVLAFDQFLEAPVFVKPPPFALDYGGGRGVGEIEDADDARIATWLGRRWKLSAGIMNISSCVLTIAKNNSFHPVRNWLNTLTWDGVERVNTWLTRYMSAEDTPAVRDIGRWMLVSAIARVFKPGCQVDTVTIFEGAQGRRKSSALRALFSPWFTDELPNFRDAQAVGQNLRGVWCVEMGELAALIGQGNEITNRAITQRSDRYRPSYGRRVRDFPRQCIFTGTTNRDDYLTDRTGNRRWHPVAIGKILLDELNRDRDQLLAEALTAFQAGAVWWPERDDQVAAMAQRASEREIGDPWVLKIVSWICRDAIAARIESRRVDGGISFLTGPELLQEALEIEPGRWGQKETQRLGDCMRSVGWTRRQRRFGQARVWVYEPPEGECASDPLRLHRSSRICLLSPGVTGCHRVVFVPGDSVSQANLAVVTGCHRVGHRSRVYGRICTFTLSPICMELPGDT